MPITLVKLIDLYVGTMLFAILNAWGIVAAPLRRKPAGEPARILVIKFWGIGSILLLAPVLRALRRRYPAAEIALLTLSRNGQLAPLLPMVDRLVTLDLERAAAVPGNLFALTIAVRRARYDLVVDCEFFAKVAAILTFASGAPVRVGFYRNERLRKRLYTAGVPFLHDRHVTKAFAALLEPLGVDVDPADTAPPPPSPEARAEAAEVLRTAGIPDGSAFVAMNVNASELAYERRWAPEKFAELGRGIVERLAIPVLLVGAPSEAGYVARVVEMAGGRLTSIAGKTTIPGLQALLMQALFFVSNDSGPLHLAAASGVPTVALFGPETPDLYGPVGEGHIVFYRRLPCSPCMSVHDMKNVVCHGKIDCLAEISASEVLARLVDRVTARHDGSMALC